MILSKSHQLRLCRHHQRQQRHRHRRVTMFIGLLLSVANTLLFVNVGAAASFMASTSARRRNNNALWQPPSNAVKQSTTNRQVLSPIVMQSPSQYRQDHRRWISRGRRHFATVRPEDNIDGDESENETQESSRDPKFIIRNKHWIIIVDDELPIREAVGNFLYDSGYQVTACADADALLEVCAKPSDEDGTLPKIPACIIRYVFAMGEKK